MCTCTCTNYFVGDVCDVVEKSYPDHDSIEFWRSIEESSDFRTRCHKKVRVHTVFLFRHWPNSEMLNLTVAIHKKNWNWVRALQHLVFEIFNYIGFDNGVCEFGPLLFFFKNQPQWYPFYLCCSFTREWCWGSGRCFPMSRHYGTLAQWTSWKCFSTLREQVLALEFRVLCSQWK